MQRRERRRRRKADGCVRVLKSPSVGVYTRGDLHPAASGPKAEAQVLEGGSCFLPRLQKALEGVHYIADHLRAEDADSLGECGLGEVPPWVTLPA